MVPNGVDTLLYYRVLPSTVGVNGGGNIGKPICCSALTCTVGIPVLNGGASIEVCSALQ